MMKRTFGISLLSLGLILGTTGSMCAQSADPKADNTKQNKRDRNAGEPTADRQKDNTSDRELTRKIRRAIMNDKSLSTYGHNVKIVTQNGAVTLKGPVHTEDEKKSIEAKATEIAGGGKVTNQLTVKGS